VNIALVASEFNAPIPDRMLEAAKARAKKLGVDVVEVVRVPGTWEIPLAVKFLLAREDVDAVVAIGVLIKGETIHDKLIADGVAPALMQLQLDAGKPVGLGITGPDMTWEQAEQRVENAAIAVVAAVRMEEILGTPPKGETSARRAHKNVH
jgi:6,7-dimethyl-8-ribityllumazine synthase